MTNSKVLPLILFLIFVTLGCGENASYKAEYSSQSQQTNTDSSAQVPQSSAAFALKIINGQEATAPQLVKLNITLSDGSIGICSATAIGVNAVLTAGHCLTQAKEIWLETADRLIQSDRWQVHPGYFEDFSLNAVFNDVGVVFTPQPHLIPALGIFSSAQLTQDQELLTFGYGLDEDSNFGALRLGTVKASIVTENHIFSIFDGSGSNPCNGDSGGPLLASQFNDAGELIAVGIVGLTSSGLRLDCQEGDTTLYTNLSSSQSSIGLVQFIKLLVPEAFLF